MAVDPGGVETTAFPKRGASEDHAKTLEDLGAIEDSWRSGKTPGFLTDHGAATDLSVSVDLIVSEDL